MDFLKNLLEPVDQTLWSTVLGGAQSVGVLKVRKGLAFLDSEQHITQLHYGCGCWSTRSVRVAPQVEESTTCLAAASLAVTTALPALCQQTPTPTNHSDIIGLD